jgi:hypothetical protein
MNDARKGKSTERNLPAAAKPERASLWLRFPPRRSAPTAVPFPRLSGEQRALRRIAIAPPAVGRLRSSETAGTGSDATLTAARGFC